MSTGTDWHCQTKRESVSENTGSIPPYSKTESAHVFDYFLDQHGLSTFGLKVIAGRWFNDDEIVTRQSGEIQSKAKVVIITEALAKKMFPDGDALGQSIYFLKSRATIIGIVATLQSPVVHFGSRAFRIHIQGECDY